MTQMINPPPLGMATILKSWLDEAYQLLFSIQQSGTTAQRPTSVLWIGRFYFDTTLGIPIWIKSVTASVATWVNGAGVVV